jgi:hypothetical protein
VDLAAIAAFTAAAISLVNVIITARLARRTHLQQRRREEARPIVARILALSSEASRAWINGALLREERLSVGDDPAKRTEVLKLQDQKFDQWKRARSALDKLRFEVAQLNLIAAQPVRDAAAALLLSHESVAIAQFRSIDSSTGLLKTVMESKAKMLQTDLVERTREDLGLPRDRRRPARLPGMWWGRDRPRPL